MFQVTPIPTAVVAQARARLAAGDPTVQRRTVTTPNSSPCRHCLRDGLPGETMLLFAHAPFEGPASPYVETGPVFAHEHCEAAALAVGELPEITRTRAQVMLRAYDRAGDISGARLVAREDARDTLAAFFADAAVAYVHARSASLGCFTYRIDRA